MVSSLCDVRAFSVAFNQNCPQTPSLAVTRDLSGAEPLHLRLARFTDSIVQQMFEQIERSKIVVFVATGRNPNAFYEAGYAVALQKEVITVTDEHSSLPFDIRDRNAIAYGNTPSKLFPLLTSRIARLTKVDASSV